MAKRIAVCLDGTWNSEEVHDGGAKTNIARLYDALDNGSDQIAHYFPGVGTNVGEKVPGGAFGWRLFDQIKDPYRYLSQNYEPGDQIYIFGFSRGAYSARSLGGMITSCGLLKKDVASVDISLPKLAIDLLLTQQDYDLKLDVTDKVFAMYKYGYDPKHRAEVDAFKSRYCHDVNVRFVGVWDTVGALGLPNGLLLSQFRDIDTAIKDRLFGFLDTKLSTRVEAAYHAVAIDEYRQPFLPTLWTENPAAPNRINVAGSNVEQVWFAGAHSNVGGGYTDAGLSDITLKWMIERAQKNALRLVGNIAPAIHPEPTAKRRDSLSEFLDDIYGGKKNRFTSFADGVFDKVKERLIKIDRTIPSGSCIHASVNSRLAATSVCEPIENCPYVPPTTLKLETAAGIRRIDSREYRIVP